MEVEKIKILVVDDSIFMRKVLVDILENEPGFEIVGEASNGAEAVEKALALRPAVITMDYKMPVMDGLEATKKIMATSDYSPGIIIFSAYTQDGIREAIFGLRSGAVDFIAKPDGEYTANLAAIKEELLNKIKIAANAYIHNLTKRRLYSFAALQGKKISTQPKVVAMGASTGGPPVLEKILKGLRGNMGFAILIVQHMPTKFTSVFADLLRKEVAFEICHAQEGDEIRAGKCYIAPSGSHMKAERYEDKEAGIDKIVIHLTKEPRVSGYRPSIDVLMNSVAENYQDAAIGIILTGMGSDGLKGATRMHDCGAHIVAQALHSAVIESMPAAIINTGIADEALTPDEIVDKLNSL